MTTIKNLTAVFSFVILSRFHPTQLCGEAVRVAGVMTYNFVAQ